MSKKNRKLKSGDTFSEWTVVDGYFDKQKALCRCSCGEIRQVLRANLMRSRTTQCKQNAHIQSRKNTGNAEWIKLGK